MAMMSSMTGSMMSRLWQMPDRKPWENKLQGYSRNVLIQQPVPSEYICGLCDLLLRQPMQSFCGHRFCLVCVFEKKEVPCPLCQQETDESLRMDSPVGQSTVHPDNAVRRTLIKQAARCPDCDWTGSYEDYDASHYEECRFHKMPCPACGVMLEVEKFDDHKANTCPKREIPCTQCGAKIPADELVMHLQEQCPKSLVDCDSCSAPAMLREKLEEHYKNSCPVYKIPCQYGCKYIFVEPSKLEDHEKEYVSLHIKHENRRMNELESVQNMGGNENNDDDGDVVMSESVSDFVPDMKTKLEELDRKLQAKTAQGSGSNPSDIGGKLDKIQEDSIKGYEKLSTISYLLEQTQDNTDAVQLKMAKAQKENNRLQSVETHDATLEQTFESLKERLRILEETSFNGTFLWKVNNFSSHMTRARNQQQKMLHSPIFYTSKYGYGLRIRLFPFGEGIATGKHLSLYVQTMVGEYDALLRWPFVQKVTFRIKNQQKPGEGDIVSVWQPDNTTALRKPTRLSNSAGGCTHFADVKKFEAGSEFVMNDTLFIQCIVDVSGLDY